MPAMMGEIEKGISISVSSVLRPMKRKRAMAQAAAMPKATFTGTTMTATSVVSPIACSVSGARMFWAKRRQPSAKAR